ncbi:MAG: hypothetical protein A3I00_05820 [Betaproteobacteria bacterium RIFCSPLOWO2_02_FULL_64_12]|nr:MAG: hypothetical protein A3I00_05820 [Betaproteobacteria bacterium RIFCSPLOWO2_02_FULL_64_12]
MAKARARYSEAARAAVRQAYYDALRGHEPFKVALQTLFETVYPTFADAHARWWRLPAEERKYHRPRSARELDRVIQEHDARHSTKAAARDAARVRAFVETWRLPRVHADEVWACLYRARENILYHQEPLRLAALRPHMKSGKRRESAPTIARRLFRYAIPRDSFEMIAKDEGPGVEPHAVSESIHVWARLLGITLPRVRRGRRRKN